MRKIPFAGIELTSQRVRGLRGTTELQGRPALLLIDWLNSHIRWCQKSSQWSQGRKNTASGRKERTTYSPIQRESGNGYSKKATSPNKYAEFGRNPVSNHHIHPEYGDEQADAGRGSRTCLARPNSQARTGAGKYSFSLFGLAGANPAVNTPRPSRGTRIEPCNFIVLISDPWFFLFEEKSECT